MIFKFDQTSYVLFIVDHNIDIKHQGKNWECFSR
jgi:hypothetical protein